MKSNVVITECAGCDLWQLFLRRRDISSLTRNTTGDGGFITTTTFLIYSLHRVSPDEEETKDQDKRAI